MILAQPNCALVIARNVIELLLGCCQGRSRIAPWQWLEALPNCAFVLANGIPEWHCGGGQKQS